MSALVGPAFLVGALSFLTLPTFIHWAWALVSALLACLFFFCRRSLLGWMAFGFCWTSVYVLLAWHPLDSSLQGKTLEVEGTVEDFAVRMRGGWRFEFLVRKEIHGRQLPSRIRLSWYGGDRVSIGQGWHFTVRLKQPRGFRNPGGFDYERWLFARRIGALGYVVRDGRNEPLAEGEGLPAIRQRLADAMDSQLDHESMRGVVKALTLGVRDEIDAGQWQVLRATGTAHLMAISGLHVGLVAGILLVFSRGIGLHLGMERLYVHHGAALISLLGASVYAGLAGFSLPTQRALIMLSLGLGAWLWQSTPSPWRSLSLALLGVLFWDPLAPLGAGFWLSFLAVAWIFFQITGRLRSPPPWQSAIMIQAVLLLGLSPLTAFFFSQVGWSSPLANAVAVPVVGLLVVPLALAGCVAWWFEPSWGGTLWHLASWLMFWVWRGLEWLSGLGEGIWHQPPQSAAVVVLALLGVLLLIMPRGLPGRWLGGILLIPLLLPSVKRPSPGEAWVSVLDVGQGLAVVVETAKHVLVYDTGPRYSDRFDAGSDIITPFLRHRGWIQLDRVIVSHADRDHSGGLSGLYGLWTPELWTSASGAFPRIPGHPCTAGQRWVWDDVAFQVLWPLAETQGMENDRSCVVTIHTRYGTVLLPGDIEEKAESLLIEKYGDALRADVLTAPHHGSSTSSSWAFLQAVKPRLVLISSGYHNRFGFPSDRNLARYQSIGAQVSNTAVAGAIEIRLVPGLEVREYRILEQHLWSWKP